MSYKFNPFTKKMDYYETGTSGSVDEVARDNIVNLAWRLAISDGLSVFKLEDGVVDEFEDETGVDTTSSTNESYDSTNDHYSPAAGVVVDNMEYASDALAQAAYVSNADTYVGDPVLYIKFDGTDGAQAYTAETGQTVTFVNTAQLDTSYKQFGSSSLLLDGDSDSVSVPDSDDWNFGSDKFTIRGFFRPTGTSGTHQSIVGQYVDGNNYWWLECYNNLLRFGAYIGGTYTGHFLITCPFTPDGSSFYHIEIGRNGTTSDDWKFFINGVSQTLTLAQGGWDGTITDLAAVLRIGYYEAGVEYYKGHIDDLEIYKGTCLHTSNFTVPTNPTSKKLDVFSESTIKTQGSYSLKGVAAITDSLNKTLTRDLASAIDLSGVSWIQIDLRSDRASNNITFGMQQSISVSASLTPSLTSAGSFERFVWSLDAVSNGAKNAISALYITLINADASNTFYVDKWAGPFTNMTLISESVEAETEPTEARFLALMEPVDTITVNTDLVAHISNDGGSNYDTVTLTDEGYFDSAKKILAGNVTLTDRSDKTMVQKITTDNNKDLKVHAWAMLWK
jgi:hypothetical protein